MEKNKPLHNYYLVLLLMLFSLFTTKTMAQCGGLTTLYQTFGNSVTNVTELKQYNRFLKTFVTIGTLPGSVSASGSRSTYCSGTEYLYSMNNASANPEGIVCNRKSPH